MVEFRQKVIGAGLNLSSSLLLRGYMDLSPAVKHVRECPHSGTRYFNLKVMLGYESYDKLFSDIVPAMAFLAQIFAICVYDASRHVT